MDRSSKPTEKKMWYITSAGDVQEGMGTVWIPNKEEPHRVECVINGVPGILAVGNRVFYEEKDARRAAIGYLILKLKGLLGL